MAITTGLTLDAFLKLGHAVKTTALFSGCRSYFSADGEAKDSFLFNASTFSNLVADVGFNNPATAYVFRGHKVLTFYCLAEVTIR